MWLLQFGSRVGADGRGSERAVLADQRVLASAFAARSKTCPTRETQAISTPEMKPMLNADSRAWRSSSSSSSLSMSR